MAWFAQISNDGTVQQILFVVDNHNLTWVTQTYGGVWVQTAENEVHKNFPAVGYTYDRGRDAFIPPKPYASWILNEQSCLWESPVPYPTDGKRYTWDETAGNWVEVINA